MRESIDKGERGRTVSGTVLLVMFNDWKWVRDKKWDCLSDASSRSLKQLIIQLFSIFCPRRRYRKNISMSMSFVFSVFLPLLPLLFWPVNYSSLIYLWGRLPLWALPGQVSTQLCLFVCSVTHPILCKLNKLSDTGWVQTCEQNKFKNQLETSQQSKEFELNFIVTIRIMNNSFKNWKNWLNSQERNRFNRLHSSRRGQNLGL